MLTKFNKENPSNSLNNHNPIKNYEKEIDFN